MSMLGEAFIRIRPEASGFQGEVESGVTSAVKKIAIAAGGIFAAEKIFDFGKEAIQQASLVQKAGESVQATYGKNADAVKAFADSAAGKFGIAEGASLQFSSTLGLTARNIGLTGGQAANMTMQLQKLAGSVGLIKGVDPTSYFDSLSKAVLGNTRGFKALGIAVTPVDEQQAALALHIKGSSKTWTDAQKALILTRVATEKLGPTMKQAQKSSGDFADQTIILRAKLQNLEERIGTDLLPIVQKLAGYTLTVVIPTLTHWYNVIAQKLQPIIQTVSKFIKAHSDTIRAMGKAIAIAVPALAGFAIAVSALAAAFALLTSPITIVIALGAAAVYAYQHWKPFRDIVNEVVAYVEAHAVPAFKALVGFVEEHSTVFKVLGAGLAVLVGGLPALVAIGIVLYEKWKPFHDLVVGIASGAKAGFDNLLAIVEGAVKAIKSAWDRFSLLRTIVEDTIGAIRNYIKAELTIIEGIIQVVMGVIHGNWSQVWQGLQTIASGVLHAIEALVSGAAGILGASAARLGSAIYNGIVHKLSSIAGAVKGALSRIGYALLGAAFAVSATAVSLGESIIQGIITGIENLIPTLAGKLLDVAKSIPGGIAHELGITSPSRVMAERIGKPIMEGIAKGITDHAHLPREALNVIVPGAGSGGNIVGGGGGGVHIANLTIQTGTPEAFLAWANQQTRMAVT